MYDRLMDSWKINGYRANARRKPQCGCANGCGGSVLGYRDILEWFSRVEKRLHTHNKGWLGVGD